MAEARPLFEVKRVSPQVTIQDLGRVGFLHSGMPTSGAQDSWALQVANALVGNDPGDQFGVSRNPGDAGLEILLPGLELVAVDSGVVAITGGDLEPRLNGEPTPMWSGITIRPGDVLAFRRLVRGVRAYLAVAGGVAVDPFLNSRATYLRGGIGGIDGRAIRPGDVLASYEIEGSRPLRRLRPQASRAHELGHARVVFGPQDHLYTEEAKKRFLEESWRMLPESDRMGFRFEGPPLRFKTGVTPKEYTPPFIVDDFIPMGGIQTPSDGLIIAMGVEGPSIGGYAKIATVISPDFGVLGQMKPGETLRFTSVSWEEAVSAVGELQEQFRSRELFEEVSDDAARNP